MVTWVIVLAIGLIIGGAAGFYFGSLEGFGRRKQKHMQAQLNQSQEKLTVYRNDVTTHFLETAKLINSMTESYQKVHEHLAKGAGALCNHEIEVNRLKIDESRRLRQPAPNSSPSASTTSTMKPPTQTKTQSTAQSTTKAATPSSAEHKKTTPVTSHPDNKPTLQESSEKKPEITAKTENTPSTENKQSTKEQAGAHVIPETMAVAEDNEPQDASQPAAVTSNETTNVKTTPPNRTVH